jgi:hypothetical protein
MPWSRPNTIYRAPKTKEPFALSLGSARGDRTRRSWWPDAPVQHPVAPPSHLALATSRDSKVVVTTNTHVSQVMTRHAPASIKRHVSPSLVSSKDVFPHENTDRMCQVNSDLTCPSVRSFYCAYTCALSADVIVHHDRPGACPAHLVAPSRHCS